MQLSLTQTTHAEAMRYLLAGMQARRAEIDQTLRDLRAQLDPEPGQTEPRAAEPAAPRKRRMSAAGRRAIAEAQRLRWAKVEAEKLEAERQQRPAPERKHHLSVTGRRAIVKAAKARWARVHAAQTMAAAG